MASHNIAQFATELKIPTKLLLTQLRAAGVEKSSESDSLSKADKDKLLDHLHRAHGVTADGEKRKILLTRKVTGKIDQSDIAGISRTIQVEARRKRTFVKRDEVLAKDTVRDPVSVTDDIELAESAEKKRQQLELSIRQKVDLRVTLVAKNEMQVNDMKKMRLSMGIATLDDLHPTMSAVEQFRKIAFQAKKHNNSTTLTCLQNALLSVFNEKHRSKIPLQSRRYFCAWLAGLEAVGAKIIQSDAGVFRIENVLGKSSVPRQTHTSILDENINAMVIDFEKAFELSFNKNDLTRFDVTKKSMWISVKKLAVELDVSANTLLAEFRAKGVNKVATSDLLSNEEIAKLPKYLQRTSGSELHSGGKINQHVNQSFEGEERTFEHRVPITRPLSRKFNSLIEFLNWLVCLEQLPSASLRENLLPLDLLPGAVIDDINERALDIVGEPALEESEDQIFVNQDVLARVITCWSDARSVLENDLE